MKKSRAYTKRHENPSFLQFFLHPAHPLIYKNSIILWITLPEENFAKSFYVGRNFLQEVFTHIKIPSPRPITKSYATTFEQQHGQSHSFFQAKNQPCHRFSIKRNQGIEIMSLAVFGFIGCNQRHGNQYTDNKSPHIP